MPTLRELLRDKQLPVKVVCKHPRVTSNSEPYTILAIGKDSAFFLNERGDDGITPLCWTYELYQEPRPKYRLYRYKDGSKVGEVLIFHENQPISSCLEPISIEDIL